MSSEDKTSYDEEVIPLVRIYLSYAKKNSDVLSVDEINRLLSQAGGPANHLKELIDKGIINIYACCFDQVMKVL